MNFCLNPRNLVSIVFVFLTAGISQAQTTTTAALTVTSVSGGSLVFPTTSSGTTSTTPRIYGAYSTAANNCTTNVIGDGLLPCNPDVIIDGSSLVVNFTWNKADAVNSRKVKFLIAPTSGGTNVQIGNPVIINAVGQYSITAPWDEIRNQVCPSGWASCSADVKTFNINLGVDDTPQEDFIVDSGLGVVINATVEVFDGTDPLFSKPCGTSDTGGAICGFSVYPGDKKFFFDDLEPATANLTGSNSINSGYKGLQIYFKEVPQGSTDIAVLESMINTDPSTSIGITSDDDFDIRLTDLKNDTRYCVIFAGVTNAGTITKFFPDNRSGAIDDASKYCDTPSEVFGLLDNKKCFVATAAYGSELDPHVQTFRNFRNQILMRSELGRTLTQFYYAHSPEYAKIISQEPILKAGVRGVLWV
ncbi:MAG: CFI-box-CTERM domain-containing protein, partial [Pseudobdellovibrionaceae bacterium]